MTAPKKYSPEVRERAVRMLKEHAHEYPSRWEAIESIAAKIGCAAQTLHNWARKEEPAVVAAAADHDRLKQLERENAELRRANEILRSATTFFAKAEFDRRGK